MALQTFDENLVPKIGWRREFMKAPLHFSTFEEPHKRFQFSLHFFISDGIPEDFRPLFEGSNKFGHFK